MIVELAQLFPVLASAGVEYILVGGMAAFAHGSPRLTQDIEIVYRRSRENVARLTSALAPYHPYLRGAPEGLPFLWDAETLWRGLNFTLTTDLGSIDLLGEIIGGGGYDNLLPDSSEVEAFGHRFRCLDLEKLIEVKRAAGRPKDLEAIAELEAILEERLAKQGLHILNRDSLLAIETDRVELSPMRFRAMLGALAAVTGCSHASKMSDARLVGCWQLVAAEGDELAEADFRADGRLFYSMRSDGRWQIMKLTYSAHSGVIETDQPSAPRAEKTRYLIEGDMLELELGGRVRRFRRGPKTAPDVSNE
jgi:hypothetical protein